MIWLGLGNIPAVIVALAIVDTPVVPTVIAGDSSDPCITKSLADDFIIRPGQRPLKYNRDDVIVGGTNLGGGGGGNTEAILGRILAAIENGGDVYMDGDKVGKSLALATSRMG